MNSPDIVFPKSSDLRLRRAPEPGADGGSLTEQQASLDAAQRQLAEDLEMMRQREDNLRAYETRLRVLQARLEGGERHVPPPAPPPSLSRPPLGAAAALDAAWARLHRARELLEVEQKHLVEGRLLLKEETQALARREAAVAEREARLAAAAPRPAPTAPAADKAGAAAGLTRAPFALARAVFARG
jgi:hypothetical protein